MATSLLTHWRVWRRLVSWTHGHASSSNQLGITICDLNNHHTEQKMPACFFLLKV